MFLGSRGATRSVHTWIPHPYPACAQHAPNEHLLAPVAPGLRIMAGRFWDLGERKHT